MSGNEDTVKFLLEQNTDLDLLNGSRNLLLSAAVGGGHTMVALVRNHGFDADARESDEKMTLCYAISLPDVQTAKLLQDHGTHHNTKSLQHDFVPYMSHYTMVSWRS